MLDLVIRNAVVFDGSGMPSYRGGVGVKDGRIVSVGRVPETGVVELDAKGLALAPGFIDVHTHYDVQLSWDGLAEPTLEHGVTTIVTGNCSLSLAPLRKAQRARMCRMFRQIEDLPLTAFDEGVSWEWETFGEWLTCIRRQLGINLAPLVGHSAIRMWVMGDDAHTREATPDEVAAMRQVLRESLAAGASGLSTSYIDVDEEFKPVPSRLAAPSELEALVATLGEEGHGVLQVVHEFPDLQQTLQRIDELEVLSVKYGVPVTLAPLFQNPHTPDLVDAVLKRVELSAERGARIWPQVPPRPMEVTFRLGEPNYVLMLPTWAKLARIGSRAEQIAAFNDPATRAQLVAEATESPDRWNLDGMLARLQSVRVRGVADPAHAGLVGRTLGELARERGQGAPDVMIDIALSEGLETVFKDAGYGHADVDIVGRALAHPNVLVGASDAGAHVQAFASVGDTGYLFSKFVREQGEFDVAGAVRKLTLEPALAWGLADRGFLAPGYAADLVLFDPATIDRSEDMRVDDLPGGAFRYIRRGRGIDTVIVNGVPAWSQAHGYSPQRAGAVVSGSAARPAQSDVTPADNLSTVR
jgi:N-acyl-D-aspartate/D-glutamate deacylase